MKMIKSFGRIGLVAGVFILSSSISQAYAAPEQNAEDRYMYFGSSIGISEPVVKKFTDKGTGGKFKLKKSKMIAAYVGYSFYPNMMIDISAEYKPKYGLNFIVPETMHTPKTPGSTKVSSDTYMVNLTYQAERDFIGLKPYATFGAGISRIRIKAAPVSTMLMGHNTEFFKIKKNTVNCFSWQVGGGIVRSLSDSVDIDLGAKLQVVNDIKLKYDKLDINSLSMVAQKPIKKTLGVGEFTLGFTFKIPV